MLALVLGAIRRRRAQAILLVLLGALAATGAAAAPGYIAAMNERVASAGAEQAPPQERLVRSQVAGKGLSLDAPQLRGLELPDFRRVRDARVNGHLAADSVTLATRDAFCAQVTVVGACDLGAGNVVVDGGSAVRLSLHSGDRISFLAEGTDDAVLLTVVGIYTPRDPGSLYWHTVPGSKGPELFAAPATLADPRLSTATTIVTLDQAATPEAFQRNDPQQLAYAMELGAIRLAAAGGQTQSELRTLADRVLRDQQFVLTGVAAGACHLLLLSWLGLYVAIRQTARNRRQDVALVKMRGGRRRDLWVLVVGQSAVPIVAGGVLGVPLGVLVAYLLAGPIAAPEMRLQALVGTGVAASVAIAGAVLAALVAEWRMLAEPVAELARAVPGRGRAWAARILAGVVIAAAGVAGYQVMTGSGTGLVGLAAPVLTALAFGVTLALLVPLGAAAVAGPGLRSGRLALGLLTVHIARRRAMAGAVAMSVLAMGVLLGAVVAWDASARSLADRAAADVGADRVLVVNPISRGALLAAVRRVDPSGRFAMAAVEIGGAHPVLAVDSTRLSAVAAPTSYVDGHGWEQLARLLRPAEPAAPLRLAGATATLTATWTWVPSDQGAHATPDALPDTAYAYVDVQSDDGAAARVMFGPLREGRHDYQATPAGCGGGCRVVAVGLGSDPDGPVPPVGSRLVVHALTQPDGGPLGTAQLTDRTRWRTSVLRGAQLPRVERVADGLALTIGPRTYPGRVVVAQAAAYWLDTPTPLPVLLQGALPAQLSIGDDRVNAFGYDVPVVVAAQVGALPRLGGGGILLDLDYADRLLSDGRIAGTAEVWLSPDAPASIVDELATVGLRVSSVETRADRLRLLAAAGSTIVLRFLLLTALAGAVLTLMVFAIVATVERSSRALELAALRRQGLAPPVVWRVGFGGYALLAVLSTATSVVAAAAVRPMLARLFPFAGAQTRAGALWGPAGLMVVIELVLAAVAARLLVRSTRREHEGRSTRE